MSHLVERVENNCLNCNAVIYGKYCHICGQENVHPRETVWHLVSHFFQDITHFDGKFFSTLKLLIAKPGFISREYMLGRRSSYLNPIRMYVFTSAIFFIIFFAIIHVGDGILKKSSNVKGKTAEQVDKMDSVQFAKFTADINRDDSNGYKPMTRAEFKTYYNLKTSDSGSIQFTPGRFRTKGAYDSALASGAKKHNWFERQLVYKQIELNEKYKGNKKQLLSVFLNTLLHSLPQLLFISLPLFAWLLHLMYLRHRRYWYVNHAIFTIHFFVFAFIALLFVFGINELASLLHWHWLNYVKYIMILGIFFYCYKAMRNFYQQGRAKTIIKFLILHIVNLVIVMILFVFFIFFSLFKI